jgi:hypothetical protein
MKEERDEWYPLIQWKIGKFLDSEYTIWLDGNIAITVPARELIKEFMQDKDIALFGHPYRDCLYDEAETCKELDLDSSEELDRHLTAYKMAGFPKKVEFCECNFIIRRNTARINDLNEKGGILPVFSERPDIVSRYLSP